jgi:hypothetical protein
MSPHLDWFKQDKDGIHFRIRRDGGYWDGVRQVLNCFGRKARYDQDTRSFTVSFSSRAVVKLGAMFPEEWVIVEDSEEREIEFTPLTDADE